MLSWRVPDLYAVVTWDDGTLTTTLPEATEQLLISVIDAMVEDGERFHPVIPMSVPAGLDTEMSAWATVTEALKFIWPLPIVAPPMPRRSRAVPGEIY